MELPSEECRRQRRSECESRVTTSPSPNFAYLAHHDARLMELASAVLKQSPEERIDAALSELRDVVAQDLLELIGRAPPEFFEKLVLELLHKMGYGTSRSDLQRTGGSGDGGIDGIISLDRLGLEKVYIQAKRWKSAVGSPEIQGFMGALQLQGASKGVFVTTSAFTREAKQAATKARGSIVLVDGERLSSLMIDNGVGVSHKELTVPKVDNDYFDEG
jgi:restriction system protein